MGKSCWVGVGFKSLRYCKSFLLKDLKPNRAYIYIFFAQIQIYRIYKMVSVDLSLPGLELCSPMDVGVCLLI